MGLIFMRIIPGSGNRLSCLGPVFRPFTDSDQHIFQKLLCYIDVPTFSWQNKVIKCVQNIYCPLIKNDHLRTKDR